MVILVNLVIRALPTKYTEYDISTTSLFTLSETTENLLHELNADVTAYYLAESGQEDDQHHPPAGPLCGREQPFQLAAARPGALPDLRPAVRRRVHRQVVLVCGDNSDVLSYNDMYELDLESYYTTGRPSTASRRKTP